MSGSVIGKGDKLGVITFNEITKQKLIDYLEVRKKLLPNDSSQYVFIPLNGNGKPLSEYGLNKILKKAAKRA